ncbi:bifunctional UDP-sugar hydrolase/5'-nucleotidase [Prevotella sp. HUN102]|uniref:bifunctional metallophosphatase/5'-nucleotidase n=1 Tax=Prevotella sp. HUN102 TaxID=1392486 RepID=UPI000490E4F0|nr:5'-nucleotidase C-terminal domain-containing protein [Prevotella sp. HUN102]
MIRFIFAIMAILLSGADGFAQKKEITIQLVETTDVHGSFFPYDFINRKNMPGSMARVSTYINNLRREKTPDNVYLMDNGDILQGQPISYYYNYVKPEKKNIAASVLNYMKYDVSTVGNHDVETGHSVYDKWIKELDCPMLGANIIDTKTNKPYLLPYYNIIKGNGVKVTVIGMLTPAIPNWLEERLWSGLRFEEMVACARKTIEEVKQKEHPDVIVGLFHSGWDGGIRTPEYTEDAAKMVAEQVSGFDVVFFGHDHTPRNTTVLNPDGKEVLCLDPANNAQKVAVAEITLQANPRKMAKKGKRFSIVKKEGKLIDVSKMEIDKAFMAHFQDDINEVKQWADREIGTFEQTIYSKDCYFGSSAFNDLIQELQMKITNADISFNAPLQFNSSIKAGPITVAEMFKLYKYENQLYVMRMTGKEIHNYLEMSYNLWVNTMQSPDDHILLLSDTKNDAQRLGFKNFSFNFDSAMGIDYEVDVTKPEGGKVKILKMTNGEPFDENKWYNVAVNSYRGNGGGELMTKGAGIPKDSLQSRIVWRSELDQRHYLMDEISKAGKLNPQPHNNWRFVPTEWTEPAIARDRKLLFGE